MKSPEAGVQPVNFFFVGIYSAVNGALAVSIGPDFVTDIVVKDNGSPGLVCYLK